MQSQTTWRTSSYSEGGDNCVEVAPNVPLLHIRDSKARERGQVAVRAAAWNKLVDALKR